MIGVSLSIYSESEFDNKMDRSWKGGGLALSLSREKEVQTQLLVGSLWSVSSGITEGLSKLPELETTVAVTLPFCSTHGGHSALLQYAAGHFSV